MKKSKPTKLLRGEREREKMRLKERCKNEIKIKLMTITKKLFRNHSYLAWQLILVGKLENQKYSIYNGVIYILNNLLKTYYKHTNNTAEISPQHHGLYLTKNKVYSEKRRATLNSDYSIKVSKEWN